MTGNASMFRGAGTNDSSIDGRHSVTNGKEAGPLNRDSSRALWVRLGSLAVLAVSVIVIAWSLPIGRAVEWLQSRIEELGSLGPIVFVAAYIVAALLFVPGSALTIAAGVIFGLGWGVVVVSIASTLAAAAAFLIGRYAARRSVERLARRYPQFSAIDQAIGEGGWKIVALLRLSPVVPFSAGNYLFGLTAVRFWPYVLASWLAMLPGTVLYVYLGHVGIRGVVEASGGSERTPAEWTFLGIGLAATAAVTIYLSKLARRRIREDVTGEEHGTHREEKTGPSGEDSSKGSQTSRWSTVAAPLAALIFAAAAVAAAMNRSAMQNMFGPPKVEMKEAYSVKIEGPSFDHGVLNELLKKHIADGGWVNYEGLQADSSELDSYIASVATAPFSELDRNEKLALLTNAYNAFTLRLILDHYPLNSITDIPAAKRWEDKRWRIGKNTWTLNQIEHEQIRPMFREPRIHFALVCAAVGCPPLRTEVYTGADIEKQLEDQARYVHKHDRWFRFDADTGVVHLTELYDWYGNDFKQVAGSVLQYAAKYSRELQRALEEHRDVRIQWIQYDWRLNSRENKP